MFGSNNVAERANPTELGRRASAYSRRRCVSLENNVNSKSRFETVKRRIWPLCRTHPGVQTKHFPRRLNNRRKVRLRMAASSVSSSLRVILNTTMPRSRLSVLFALLAKRKRLTCSQFGEFKAQVRCGDSGSKLRNRQRTNGFSLRLYSRACEPPKNALLFVGGTRWRYCSLSS